MIPAALKNYILFFKKKKKKGKTYQVKNIPPLGHDIINYY